MSALEKIGEALGDLSKSVLAWLDLIDLSFIVAGGLMVALVSWMDVELHLGLPINFHEPNAVEAIAILLFTYALGLIAFATGRLVRQTAYASPPETTGAVIDHAFEKRLFGEEFAYDRLKHEPGKPALAFAYLWAVLRDSQDRKEVAPAFQFVQKAWVRLATYDSIAGVLMAWFIGIGVTWAVRTPTAGAEGGLFQSVELPIGVLIALLWALGMAIREGRRSDQALYRDVVTAVAWYLAGKPPARQAPAAPPAAAPPAAAPPAAAPPAAAPPAAAPPK